MKKHCIFASFQKQKSSSLFRSLSLYRIQAKFKKTVAMFISRKCICNAKRMYIYREKSVHLSRKGVRLMSFLKNVSSSFMRQRIKNRFKRFKLQQTNKQKKQSFILTTHILLLH